MQLQGVNVVLSAHESSLLRLACEGAPSPEPTVAALANWLAAPPPENVSAIGFGARAALAQCFRDAFVVGSEAVSGSPAVWVVTRHIGALAWLYLHGVRAHRVRTHLAPDEPCAGDRVIGVLPVALAARLGARGVDCVHLVLDVGMHERGRELGLDAMERLGARLARYDVAMVGDVRFHIG